MRPTAQLHSLLFGESDDEEFSCSVLHTGPPAFPEGEREHDHEFCYAPAAGIVTAPMRGLRHIPMAALQAMIHRYRAPLRDNFDFRMKRNDVWR